MEISGPVIVGWMENAEKECESSQKLHENEYFLNIYPRLPQLRSEEFLSGQFFL